MATRSLRLKRDTPPEDVIAALNGALERLDAVEGKAEPADVKAAKAAKAVPPDPSIEPTVRIVGSMISIESGDDTVETRIYLPSGGMPYAAFLKALPTYD